MAAEAEAEAEPRRWAATYTKHVKQKRKAYQDGAIVLHRASGNLVLLDDAGGTVECRTLRAGEEVFPGAWLAFQRHLVDVGEPEPHPGSGSSSAAASSASRDVHRGGASARARPSAVNSRPPRAFADPNTKGGGGGGGKDEAVGSSFQEWTALYTTQLTQKAKKFHDGVVRLAQVGSHAKQIILLDEEGEVLATRYLKSGESLETGKKCHFPNYLIEICEAKSVYKLIPRRNLWCKQDQGVGRIQVTKQDQVQRVNHSNLPVHRNFMCEMFVSTSVDLDLEDSKSSNTAGSSKPETSKIGVVDAGSSGNIMGSTDSGFKEWSALYTTQLTQKAKKYHDGVIKLVQVGSHAKQIVLLDEDGGVLGSRYLKSGESVESGMKCQLPNYLIEVCEIRKQKNDVESKHPSELVLSQTGSANGHNTTTTDRTDGRNKSPKFVSPLKFNHFQKSRLQGSNGFNRPTVAKSILHTNMSDTLKFHGSKAAICLFAGTQMAKPDFTVGYKTDLDKSTFSNLDDPHQFNVKVLVLSPVFADDKQDKTEYAASYNPQEVGKSSYDRVDSPLGFCDLQDGKSGSSTSFLRREVGKTTFGNTDDSLRTARDADHSKTASNISVINSSNRTIGVNMNSRMSHCATQLRASVLACLNLETLQTRNSISTTLQSELSGNAHPTYDHQTIMSPTTFDSLELYMVDTPTSDVSNAKEQSQGSTRNHQTESSKDSAPAMCTTSPDPPSGKSETADQVCILYNLSWKKTAVCEFKLSSGYRVVDEKCGSYPFLSAGDLTLTDDDCPSFDLGF
uniref:5'-3' DNA helicase ZGRF1-like N-terminal domain-containing protein n=1 Tax=Oryza meridionalis TaxID=40149 RepID=A0A0E0ERE6_9ORYZ